MERLAIDIELVRKTGVDAPYEFQVEAEFQPQKYFLREGTGIHSELTLDWNKQLLTDLGTVQDPLADDDLRARLGERLRAFLDGKGTWKHREKQLSDIAGRLVEVNFVSGAAELYALPWELLRDQRTGLSVAMSDRVLWRYCWPERARALLKTRLSAAGNRILFAWSNDGGAVPWEVHLAALQETVKDGFLSFQGDQDMLAGVSSATIEAALASARDASRPYRVLHVLCHGRLEDNVYKLVWRDGNTLSPTEFAALVEPYAGELFLVVICACQSGGHGSPESRTGSVAQALHRAGIPVVIASRFPLSKEGSSKFCQSFYRALNGAQAGVEAAFLKARRALQVGQYGGDHLALQLWSQPLMGVAARERKLWHNLPQLRSGGFVDRRDVIEAVRDHFARQEVGNAVQPLHLSGLPGVGKTAVACEFAYQQMKDYETILWVDAQLGDITPQIAELAEHLIPDHDPSRTVEQIAQDVRLALENGGSHLIILDHVENDAIDETHLPKTGKAHVLVTSRREKLAMMETLEIKLLSTEDALLLLCGGRQLEEETLQAAEKLCEVLGRLTLPLKVAAAALTSLGPADLLEWIQDTGALRPIDELAAEHDDEAPGKGPALTLLFEKSVSLLDASDKATAVDRVARQMLYVAGYFGAAEIPLDLIANATRRAGGEEYKNHLVRRAVGRLASIGLADWSGDAVLIHRLIQAYARSRSGAAERLAVESSMAEILKDTSRLPEDLLGLGKLRVHMEAVCETMRADTPLQHLWIPVRLAQHLVMAMSYRRALDVTERWIRMLGENATPWHAQLLNIRGEALYEMGRINEAVDCLRKVESVMAGLEDIDPAIRVQNQAILFKALIDKGDFKEGFGIAQALYNDLGDDPLAEVGKIMTPERLFDFSRLREVIPQMEQALARSCEAMGQDHPAVVSLLKATARINVTAGRFERARVLSRRAAEYAERVYGREHVNVAEALEIFGGTSIDSGHVDEAIEALQRARGILESVPQANPVHRTAVLALLARAHLRKGSMTEAQDLATKAASFLADEEFKTSPYSLFVLQALVECLLIGGQKEQVAKYQAQIQQIIAKLMGESNPAMLGYLSAWQRLSETTDETEIVPALRYFVIASEAAFGPEHPAVGSGLFLLSTALVQTNPAEAEQLLRRSLVIFESTYGEDHSQVAVVAEYLGFALIGQDKSHDAVPYLQRFIDYFESTGQAMNVLMPQAHMGIGVARLHEGLFDEAFGHLKRAKEIADIVYAADHPIHRHIEANIGFTEANLGFDYAEKGDQAACIEHLERGVRLLYSAEGPKHEATVRNMRDLVFALRSNNDWERAMEWVPRYLEVIDQPDRNSETTALLKFLGSAGRTLERYDKAEEADRRLLAILQGDPDVDPDQLINAWLRLAKSLLGQEKTAAVRDVLETALRIADETGKSESYDAICARAWLAAVEQESGNSGEAWRLYEYAQKARENAKGLDEAELASLGELLTELRKDLESKG